jgi:hypothetical protein
LTEKRVEVAFVALEAKRVEAGESIEEARKERACWIIDSE